MKKTNITLACSLILVSVLACRANLFGPTPTPTHTPPPVVSVEELQFEDSETGERFRALDRCIQNMADASWQRRPYRMGGNFYSGHWCRGNGARSDCQITSSKMNDRDQQAIELYTLFYIQDYPQVFGLGFLSLWVPESTGWGALFSFAENGEGVVGAGWGVTFRKYVTPGGPPEATVSLGWKYSYTIFGPNQTTFEQPADLPLREDLALHLASPEEMRERAVAQNRALAQKVSAAIDAHQVNTCDLGPYLGKGIPPACTPRPLTREEEALELARAEAYFTEQEKLLRKDYQDMYAAWMAAFPLDQCWP